jgi:hypothetical protein
LTPPRTKRTLFDCKLKDLGVRLSCACWEIG